MVLRYSLYAYPAECLRAVLREEAGTVLPARSFSMRLPPVLDVWGAVVRCLWLVDAGLGHHVRGHGLDRRVPDPRRHALHRGHSCCAWSGGQVGRAAALPTFMGNPLACAAANASLGTHQRRRLACPRRPDRCGPEIWEILKKKLEAVRDVRTSAPSGVIALPMLRTSHGGHRRCHLRYIWVPPRRLLVHIAPVHEHPAG